MNIETTHCDACDNTNIGCLAHKVAGETVLAICPFCVTDEELDSLMEAKADPMVRNMEGVSSWDLALCGTTGAVRRVFSPSCVDIDTALGSTPAAAVSEFAEQKEQVRQLLAASMRADVPRMKSVLEKVRPTMPIIDVPNLMLVSPLMFASRFGHASTAAILRMRTRVVS